ncbi:hypothetical protein TB2_015717 [Malus domestica]
MAKVAHSSSPSLPSPSVVRSTPAGISLTGAMTAVSYCTLIWVVSVTKDRPNGVSYKPLETKSDAATVFSVLNALGITTFAFRGHNPVLEIQGTMPSSSKRPSRLPMWEGVIPFLNIQNVFCF